MRVYCTPTCRRRAARHREAAKYPKEASLAVAARERVFHKVTELAQLDAWGKVCQMTQAMEPIVFVGPEELLASWKPPQGVVWMKQAAAGGFPECWTMV